MPVRPVAIVALVLGLAGCATLGPPGPGIEARSSVVPEERSTCEVLARVDLAVIATDPVSVERSAAALDQAASRAPADITAALAELADAFHEAAEDPAAVAALVDAPTRPPVLTWFATRCGGR